MKLMARDSSLDAEDVALAQAIKEGLDTGRVSKQDVLDVLEEEPPVTIVDEYTCDEPSENSGL